MGDVSGRRCGRGWNRLWSGSRRKWRRTGPTTTASLAALSCDCKGKVSSAFIYPNALKDLPPPRHNWGKWSLRSAGVFEESAADFHPSVRVRPFVRVLRVLAFKLQSETLFYCRPPRRRFSISLLFQSDFSQPANKRAYAASPAVFVKCPDVATKLTATLRPSLNPRVGICGCGRYLLPFLQPRTVRWQLSEEEDTESPFLHDGNDRSLYEDCWPASLHGSPVPIDLRATYIDYYVVG